MAESVLLFISKYLWFLSDPILGRGSYDTATLLWWGTTPPSIWVMKRPNLTKTKPRLPSSPGARASYLSSWNVDRWSSGAQVGFLPDLGCQTEVVDIAVLTPRQSVYRDCIIRCHGVIMKKRDPAALVTNMWLGWLIRTSETSSLTVRSKQRYAKSQVQKMICLTATITSEPCFVLSGESLVRWDGFLVFFSGVSTA